MTQTLPFGQCGNDLWPG